MTTEAPRLRSGQATGMIPGSRERNALTSRQPGSGGYATRLDVVKPVGSLMDATTIAARQREGGGAPSQRVVVTTGEP